MIFAYIYNLFRVSKYPSFIDSYLLISENTEKVSLN